MTRGVRKYLVGSVVLVALIVVAGCSGHFMFAEREPWRHDAEVACLNSGAVKETPQRVRISAINGPGVCGADFPIKISALGESGPLGYDDEPVRPPNSIPSGAMPQRWPIQSSPLPPPQADASQAAPPQYSQPQYGQPQYQRPQYPQSQYNQPQYGQPQYGQPQYGQPQYAGPTAGAPMSLRPPGIPEPDQDDDVDDPPGPSGPYGPYGQPGPPRPAYGAPIPPAQSSVPSYPQRPPALPPAAEQIIPLGPPRGPGVTGAVGPVAVKPAATLACPIVSQLDQWISGAVQPAALKWFRQPVVEIKQISAYSCRGMNGNPNAHISEHAFGNALDIAEFFLADGRKVSVQYGWHGAPEEQGFLHDVQAAACQQFSTVLAPGANVYHYNHIHVDLMRHASGRHICEPGAIAGEVVAQRARARYAAEHRGYTGVTGTIGRPPHPGILGYSDDDDRLPAAIPGDD